MKIIFYRPKTWRENGGLRFGLWRMSNGTALDIGPFRIMTRRTFMGANKISDWWGE